MSPRSLAALTETLAGSDPAPRPGAPDADAPPDAAPAPYGHLETTAFVVRGRAEQLHVWRATAGAPRMRIVIDTPGDGRTDWRFSLEPFPAATVQVIGHDHAHPSSPGR